jgi:tetratricopeptide (TPR) repeat protein
LTLLEKLMLLGVCALSAGVLLAPARRLRATTQTGRPESQAQGQPGQSPEQQADAAYQQGTQLLGERQYGEALKQFQLVERLAPHLPQGPSGQGIALALMGKPEEAIEALKKALHLDPSFWVAKRELGIVYWSQGLKQQSAEQLRPVVQRHPDDEAGNAILGQYEFEQNHYEQALGYLSHVPGQVAADPGLSLMVAQAQLKTGKTSEARETLKGLVRRPGLTNSQLFDLAWTLGQAELYKESIQTFNQLPPEFPDKLRHNYGLALAYFGDSQYEPCIATLSELLKSGATAPEVYSLLGVAQEKAGHTKEAYDAFRQGILNNPRDAQNYLDIATLACEHLSYDLAVQILTSGIELNPNSQALVLSRGIAHTLKVEFRAAEQDYARAIRMAPHDHGNYVALGLSKLESGDLEEAIQALQKASELEPEDPHPYYFETEALLQKGLAPGTPRFDQARRAIETALRLDPNLAYAYADRARLELLANDTASAVSDLERARAADPKSTSITYLLAQAYRRNGQKEKADALFVQVKELSDRDARQFVRDSLTQTLVVTSQSGH